MFRFFHRNIWETVSHLSKQLWESKHSATHQCADDYLRERFRAGAYGAADFLYPKRWKFVPRKRFCQHIASTCCHHHPGSHHTMNYFYNFKYGKVFCVLLLWSKLLANKNARARQKKIMNGTFGEHSALDYASRAVVRGEWARIAGGSVEMCTAWRRRKNKLFVVTSFKCLRFISFSIIHDVDVWELAQVTALSSSIILWFKFLVNS